CLAPPRGFQSILLTYHSLCVDHRLINFERPVTERAVAPVVGSHHSSDEVDLGGFLRIHPKLPRAHVHDWIYRALLNRAPVEMPHSIALSNVHDGLFWRPVVRHDAARALHHEH